MCGSIDWDGVKISVAHIHKLVEQEINLGVPVERIIIGGFSQGGCLAVRAALRFPKVCIDSNNAELCKVNGKIH